MKILGGLAFLAGAILTGFLIYRAGLAPVASALASFGFAGLAIIALAHLPIVALLGMAWWSIAPTARRSRLILFVWARAVRDAAAEALPFSQVGGYVIGARALTLSGAEASSSGLSTLLDLVVEFIAKIPYLLTGLFLLEWLRPVDAGWPAIIAIVICIAAVAMLFLRGTSAAPRRMLEWLFARWSIFARSRQRMLDLFEQMTARRRRLLPSLALHFVCWVLGAGETWLIFRLMHQLIALGPALVIDALVGGMRMLSFFVPGSIGVQEGGYVLLCGLFGFSPGTALAFSFARRARDLLIASPVLLSWQYREAHALLPARSQTPPKR